MDQYLATQKSIGINVGDRRGRTVLLWAVIRGDPDAVSTLLRYGANPDQKDLKGRTPLTFLRPGILAMVRLLLNAGANINIQNHYGRSLPLMAVGGRHYSVLKYCLSNSDIDPDVRTTQGDDIFTLAARLGDAQTLEILRDVWRSGVNLERRSEDRSALQWAKFRRYYDPEHWMAKLVVRPQEPRTWYKLFVDMIRTIRRRQSMVCSQAMDMVDGFAVGESEDSDEEGYEDAMDRLEEEPFGRPIWSH